MSATKFIKNKIKSLWGVCYIIVRGELEMVLSRLEI